MRPVVDFEEWKGDSQQLLTSVLFKWGFLVFFIQSMAIHFFQLVKPLEP